MGPRRLSRFGLGLVALGLFVQGAAAADITTETVIDLLRVASEKNPADFSRKNLAGLDLAGVDFKRANLAGANLAGANLAGAIRPCQVGALEVDPGEVEPREILAGEVRDRKSVV